MRVMKSLAVSFVDSTPKWKTRPLSHCHSRNGPPSAATFLSKSKASHLSYDLKLHLLIDDSKKKLLYCRSSRIAASSKGSFDSNEGEYSEYPSSVASFRKRWFLIVLWCLTSMLHIAVTKQLLKQLPCPITLSAIQFGICSALITLTWMLKWRQVPDLNSTQYDTLAPFVAFHAFGTSFANQSLVFLPVCLALTIRSMDPIFGAFFSALYHMKFPRVWECCSLLLIAIGVMMATLDHISLYRAGFMFAIASSIVFQVRFVVSRRARLSNDGCWDIIDFYSVMTILSCLCLCPVAFFIEGKYFSPKHIHHMILKPWSICKLCLLSAVAFFISQLIAYKMFESEKKTKFVDSVKGVMLAAFMIGVSQSTIWPSSIFGVEMFSELGILSCFNLYGLAAAQGGVLL